MNPQVTESLHTILSEQFHVEVDKLSAQTLMSELGLDSLSLVEFVFAVEDKFGLRIPEEKLDPRQAELSLGDVQRALEDALAHGQAPLPNT
jgi:acyl carrier protein